MILNNCPKCGSKLDTSGRCPIGCTQYLKYIYTYQESESTFTDIKKAITANSNLLAIIASELERIRHILTDVQDAIDRKFPDDDDASEVYFEASDIVRRQEP